MGLLCRVAKFQKIVMRKEVLPFARGGGCGFLRPPLLKAMRFKDETDNYFSPCLCIQHVLLTPISSSIRNWGLEDL